MFLRASQRKVFRRAGHKLAQYIGCTHMKIPMSSPDITQVEIDAVNEVIRTSYLSIGPKITAFEDALARYVHTTHAIGVNSGTSGLHLAMIAAGIGEMDEVITPSFSF